MTRQGIVLFAGSLAMTLQFIAARYAGRRAAVLARRSQFCTTGIVTFGAQALLMLHGDGGGDELRYAQSYDLAGALSRNAFVLPTWSRLNW